MKVLHVAAEVAPYVTVGGLSQVMYFLPKSQKALGTDVRIFTAKYAEMDRNAPREGWKLDMNLQWMRVPVAIDTLPRKAGGKIEPEEDADSLICNVKETVNNVGIKVYFLEHREYYETRANVFAYKDDHIRFALLCKGCLEWLLFQRDNTTDGWFPDIIHCHDWHTGYLVDLGKRNPRYQSLLKDVKIVFTVHNFAYQGNYDFRYTLDKNPDDGKRPLAGLLDPKMQKQNALLRGIQNADAVNTVSPTYAKEVMTPEFSEGLHKELQKIKKKLTGIMNGLDFEAFDPEKDPHLVMNFNPKTYSEAHKTNKKDIQSVFGLPVDEDKFVIGSVGRVAPQKGWDLVLEVLPNLLRERPEIQMIIVGRGDDHYCQQLYRLKQQYQKQLGLRLIADFTIPRKLFASCDAILIASSFEPGGIVAFEAMRYGAVPIIRRTGGLNDAVSDFNPATGKGNGFSFTARTPWALYGAIVEAATFYTQKQVWQRIVTNCLKYDSSWQHSAKRYLEWYREIVYAT
jgi:starch synthase